MDDEFGKLSNSILLTIKKMLGLDTSYNVFDMDVMVGINSAFSTLYQLGVPITRDLMVTGDKQKWSDFIEEPYWHRLSFIPQYVYLKVRVIFDPPTSSFVLDAYNKQISELEWRITDEIDNIGEEENDV